jgi:histidinol dehydrogenase
VKIIRYHECNTRSWGYRQPDDLSSVKTIIESVQEHGDEAVRQYTEEFDNVQLVEFEVGEQEIERAVQNCDERTRQVMVSMIDNVRKFAKRQRAQLNEFEFEIEPDVFVGQRVAPVQRVGVYAPGGRFPLISSVIMCAIPAQVAGVQSVVLCSPPRFQGSIHPTMVVAARLCGVHHIYHVGGVQAIAALAYGTESISPVDMIVGPGNKYVTQAKKEVYGKVGIDFIAGPTEVVIIADEGSNAAIIAADILAQAEHDIDALPMLVTTSMSIAEQVEVEVSKQLRGLRTRDIAEIALAKNGLIIVVDGPEQAIELANLRAPEHLELHVKDPHAYTDALHHYGSLFIGERAGEALGDYSSGLNHTLPTNACARYTAGLNVTTFLRLQTTLRVESGGLDAIGPVAQAIAEIEGLDGHAKSVKIRSDGV